MTVLCLSKNLSVLTSAVDTLEVDDAVLRTLLIATKVSHAGQILLDNYVWLSSIGLVSVDSKPLVKAAAHLWLLTLILRLTRNVSDLVHITKASSRQSLVREKSCDNGVALVNAGWEVMSSSDCVRHGLLNCVLLRRTQCLWTSPRTYWTSPSPVQATDRSLIGRSAGSVWHAWLVLVSRSCLESSTETDSILAYRRLGNKLNNNVCHITFVL